MSVNRVMMQMINLAGKSSHRFLYLQHTADDFASRQKTSLDFFSFRKDNSLMQEINSEEVLKEFGQRTFASEYDVFPRLRFSFCS